MQTELSPAPVRRVHAGSGRRHGEPLEDVNVAQRGIIKRGELLAAIYAAGYVEPWVRSGGGGEGANEASCLIEATMWG